MEELAANGVMLAGKAMAASQGRQRNVEHPQKDATCAWPQRPHAWPNCSNTLPGKRAPKRRSLRKDDRSIER